MDKCNNEINSQSTSIKYDNSPLNTFSNNKKFPRINNLNTQNLQSIDSNQHSARISKNVEQQLTIIPELKTFPYCIVWTKLPCLSYLCPFVGHTGIASSKGIIHDFSGNYVIRQNNFAFGAPLKYYQLELNEEQKQKWNEAIEESNKKFCRSKYKLFTNNCHHHCAYVLNKIKYKNKDNYGTCTIICLLCCNSKFVSCKTWFITYWCMLMVLFILAALIITLLCVFLI